MLRYVYSEWNLNLQTAVAGCLSDESCGGWKFMVARLGRVFFWGASGIAALAAAWALYGFSFVLTHGSTDPIATELYAAKWAVGASAVWLVGRAGLYVLANE
jgi:hypothetical protein